MATFVMLGSYSIDSVGKISAKRTKDATAVIGDIGGEVKASYALLGEKDVIVIVDFPGVKEAMKASVELTKLLGISFTTAPAVTMDEFDRLMEGK
ncbi:MAG: GYD domain-containing protein [Anaerolineae bacterium]|jgi:uncharacterized protein with GYD domain